MEAAEQRWRAMSETGLRSARRLFDDGDYRGSANRSYYAAHHAATAACVEHGDAFGRGWNNPPHEQLPELLRDNGSLRVSTRRVLVAQLGFLRNARESTNYRPGITVDESVARQSLRFAANVLYLLGVDGDT